MECFKEGNLVPFVNTFRNPETGAKFDPGAVFFSYSVGVWNNGTWIPYAAPSTPIEWDGTTTTPAVGVLAKTGTGIYATWVDSTGVTAPMITGKWWSTDTAQSADWDTVEIEHQPF